MMSVIGPRRKTALRLSNREAALLCSSERLPPRICDPQAPHRDHALAGAHMTGRDGYVPGTDQHLDQLGGESLRLKERLGAAVYRGRQQMQCVAGVGVKDRFAVYEHGKSKPGADTADRSRIASIVTARFLKKRRSS